MEGNQNGWNEYSKLVLKELETLAEGIKGLSNEIQELKGEIAELKAKEDRVKDIKEWKEKIDEVASPSQLSSALREIDDLKHFKTKAVTVFAVVQFLMAMLVAASKVM
jgi:uncharacterized protein YoxC